MLKYEIHYNRQARISWYKLLFQSAHKVAPKLHYVKPVTCQSCDSHSHMPVTTRESRQDLSTLGMGWASLRDHHTVHKAEMRKIGGQGAALRENFFFFWNCLRWRCEILIFRYLWSCHSRLCATRTRDRYLFLDKHISEALVCVWWGPQRARPKALSGLWYRVRWSSSGLLKGQITPGRGCSLLVQSPEERESKSPEHGHG